MPKLFAVFLGGRAEGCNIELHDVVFVVGESLEETYPQLIKKWFGAQKRLHIDSSVELKFIDGHEIILSKEKPIENNKKLYFINFGGYKPGYFGELHDINFYVTTSKNEVIGKAKEDLCVGTSQQHCDDALLLDDIMLIDHVDQYYIHLKKTSVLQKLNVESYYRKFNKESTSA